ncbi:MAG: hypothetical protein MZU91_12540 [Desulfosudis oleivorans]|nr:hypothetical protein [Desulfosudis oleivorans]
MASTTRRRCARRTWASRWPAPPTWRVPRPASSCTRPGLADMLEAVKVSRAIYQRMQSWVLAMITRKTGVPGFLAVGVIAFGVFVDQPAADGAVHAGGRRRHVRAGG